MFGLLPMGIYPWEYTHGNTPAEIQENGWMQAKASHTEQKGMEKMIKAGIIGATGYAGGELVRLLTAHPEVEIAWYGSRSYIDKKYYEVYRNMFRIVDDKCMDDNMAVSYTHLTLPTTERV